MLEKSFKKWLTDVKKHNSANNRISICLRIERAKHINLDDVYNNQQEWDALLAEFSNYTFEDWQSRRQPSHGIAFAANSNWYTNTKNILSALNQYSNFKKFVKDNPDYTLVEQQEAVLGSQSERIRIFYDCLFPNEATKEAATYNRYLAMFIETFNQLNPRENAVITMLFGISDGIIRSHEEVGRLFNVPRERIRQIEAKALRKLRHFTRCYQIKHNSAGRTEDVIDDDCNQLNEKVDLSVSLDKEDISVPLKSLIEQNAFAWDKDDDDDDQ